MLKVAGMDWRGESIPILNVPGLQGLKRSSWAFARVCCAPVGGVVRVVVGVWVLGCVGETLKILTLERDAKGRRDSICARAATAPGYTDYVTAYRAAWHLANLPACPRPNAEQCMPGKKIAEAPSLSF